MLAGEVELDDFAIAEVLAGFPFRDPPQKEVGVFLGIKGAEELDEAGANFQRWIGDRELTIFTLDLRRRACAFRGWRNARNDAEP